jgi:RHS repeat-associated protein
VAVLSSQLAGVPVRAATAAVSYTYDPSGRLATVTTTAGTATYHYDAEGNLLSITHGVLGPQGAGTGARRTAAPMPTIASARPRAVAPGKTVTISGQGFSASAVKDVVRIGALVADVTAASPTRLRVAAPPGTGGVVRVTTPGGTALGPHVHINEPVTPDLPVIGRDRHPLRAPAGVTALSGLVENNKGKPLARVRISLVSLGGHTEAAAVTGLNGQFLLAHLGAGRHQLIISGNDVGGRQYGVYAEPVELPWGRTTVLPWITYLTPLDLAHAVTITSPVKREVTVTTPKIPGLEIQIPKGTVIRDHDGRVVTRVSITPLKVGRTPYPLAPGMQPGFFTLQPGDATVSGPGLRVIYPNASGQPPGTAIPFFTDTPTWPGTGWWQYGTGHVSADGTQIVPRPGTSWHNIFLGGFGVAPHPQFGPKPKACGGGGGGGGDGNTGPPPNSCGSSAGDPVDLGTGLFTYLSTDLSLQDVQGFTLTRTFRQLDDTVRDFGIGMSSSLNFYVVAGSNSDFNLYLPDGGSVSYTPTSTTGLYQSLGSPTAFAGSTLTWTGGDTLGPFTVTLTDGVVLSFGDPAYLTKITDRYGNAITINRNELAEGVGQLQNVTTSDGLWAKFTYGSCVASSPTTSCVTQVQDNSGRTLTYSYDSFGRLTAVTDPAGGTTSYTWAPCTSSITCTEMLTVTDPDGHVTTNTYDPTTGRVTGQTDGVGGTWGFSYQANGQGQITQADVTDPRGIPNDYTFDANGYPSTVTDAAGTPDAQTVTSAYDPTTSLLTSVTDSLGRTTSYTYNALGNVTSMTKLAGTANPSTYTFTYEPTYSRLTGITDPLGRTTTITYNDAAQTETMTDALGHQWVITLNNEGQPIGITNPLGQSTYLSYLYGELVAVVNPLGQTTGGYYDSVGQLLQVTDPLGNTAGFTWTPLGELATSTSPLGAITSNGYDGNGNLTTVTDANGNKTTFTFNGDNQLTKRTDALGNAYSYSYDPDQNLSSATDPDGNNDTFGYDDLNRLTTADFGVTGGTAQTSTTYTYDAADRLTKAVQAPGGTYTFSYDGLNDLLSQSSPQGNVTHTYNADALATSLTVPHQTQITYSYDADSRLTKITQGTAKVTLGYDANSDPATVALPDGITRTTTYNAATEPTALTFKHGSTNTGTIGYAYTPDGQISSESGSLARANLPAAVTSNTYNADNELTSSGGTAYSYNNDGDLTSNGASTYTWNAQNQLTSISGPTTAAYTYNPLGQQATATTAGTTTSYLYDGVAWNSNVVQEQSAGTPTANLLAGAPGQIFQLTTPSGTNSSLLTGPLGSTIALANSSGSITTSYTYDPSGVVTQTGATSPNTFEFNATQNIGAGLYRMGARYYNPATGTFISRDPTGFNGGTTNLYSYAKNDPINQSDPSGCGCNGNGGGNGGGGGASPDNTVEASLLTPSVVAATVGIIIVTAVIAPFLPAIVAAVAAAADAAEVAAAVEAAVAIGTSSEGAAGLFATAVSNVAQAVVALATEDTILAIAQGAGGLIGGAVGACLGGS